LIDTQSIYKIRELIKTKRFEVVINFPDRSCCLSRFEKGLISSFAASLPQADLDFVEDENGCELAMFSMGRLEFCLWRQKNSVIVQGFVGCGEIYVHQEPLTWARSETVYEALQKLQWLSVNLTS
jgi:hypothetical protein